MMLVKSVACLLLTIPPLLVAGCQGPAKSPVSSLPKQMAFALPKVEYAMPDAAKPVAGVGDSASQDGRTSYYVGKFDFAQRIFLSQPAHAEGVEDYSFDSKAYLATDTVGADGLEVVADYATGVYYKDTPGIVRCAYPVYVVNATAHHKTLQGAEHYLLAVQEAIDSIGVWRPIERQLIFFCGNSYWREVLRPQQMGMFLAQRYPGRFKTWLRVRMANGNCRYVSAAYRGQIDARQFARASAK